MSTVLDSSAVLALLQAESGSETVLRALPDALISAVNVAEILRVLVRSGVAPTEARRAFDRLHLTIVPFGPEHAEECMEVARHAPSLSLGDCACLALARLAHASEVITADREWTRHRLGVKVTLVR